MAMFGPHVVTLIDFLGQSGQLVKWDFSPETVGEVDEWTRAVRQSMGIVMAGREAFEKFFAQYQQTLRASEEKFITGAPVEQRRQFDEYRQASMDHAHFSDTIILYSPLANEHEHWQVSNVIGFLVVCGGLLLESLANKAAFRGAVDVGMLSRFPSGDPYGPGLAKAHYLESKVAEYPRIIVGPTLLSYLDWLQSRPDSDAPTEANRTVATLCRDHITQDTDGCWIVDYLNDTFANAAGNPAGWRQSQASAFTFIQSELDRFKREKNEKLAKRYEALAAYFRSRGSGAE